MAWRLAIAGLGVLAPFLALAQQSAPKLNAAMNEHVVMIPIGSGLFAAERESTIFKPPGTGPFPLVVINHGKAHGDPRFQERARYLAATKEFVQRGYLVALPMRGGFSKSSGAYIAGGCNVAGNGQAQADDIGQVVDVLVQRPDVDGTRILIVGQSHGGLTTMALGTRNRPGVVGLINFAGGLRLDNCQWEKALSDAFADYGATTKIPSLWFYGDNDSYWGSDLPKEMHRRYVGAGGPARLVSYGRFKNDAHGMFSAHQGVPIWWSETEKFLRELGLPVTVVTPLPDPPRPPATNFAALDSVTAIPYLRDSGREGYRKFLARSLPRAFAISASGAWGWANEGDDPAARALANCQKNAKDPCQLYAVDEDVVWVARNASN